jgi:hypothetical protein
MHMKQRQLARILATDDDMREGIRALRRKCPHLRVVHELAGDPPLRRHAPGFEGLARIVVGQQLSLASAQAIWRRVQLAVQPMTPATLLKLSDKELRAAGLSRGKVRTLRAVSGRSPRASISTGWRRRRRTRCTRRSPRSPASDPGAPTSICCSALPAPMLLPPATWRCR